MDEANVSRPRGQRGGRGKRGGARGRSRGGRGRGRRGRGRARGSPETDVRSSQSPQPILSRSSQFKLPSDPDVSQPGSPKSLTDFQHSRSAAENSSPHNQDIDPALTQAFDPQWYDKPRSNALEDDKQSNWHRRYSSASSQHSQRNASEDEEHIPNVHASESGNMGRQYTSIYPPLAGSPRSAASPQLERRAFAYGTHSKTLSGNHSADLDRDEEPELEWFQKRYIPPSDGVLQKEDAPHPDRQQSQSPDDSEIEPLTSRRTQQGWHYVGKPQRRDSEGYISDADSDYEAYTARERRELAQLDAFLNPDDDEGLSSLGLDDDTIDSRAIEALFSQDPSTRRVERRRIGRSGPVTSGRSARGPRKAAEPTGDVKMRLSQASQLYVEQNYDEAKKVVQEVITLNAETHEAWVLLAAIFKDLGQIDNVIKCLLFAQHMRPRDLSGWFSFAEYALEQTGEKEAEFLAAAQFAYSAALRADHTSLEGHMGKAHCFFRQQRMYRAVTEYKYVLKLKPHDLWVLGRVAEACIDTNDVDTAICLYKDSINHFRASPDDTVASTFGWSDADTYLELFAYAERYEEAMKELKSLARWLLGRGDESFWDEVTEDDCEWDVSDARRLRVENFEPEKFPSSYYGAGLPLEFRVKLGVYRARLFSSECERHFGFLDPENRTGENRALENPDLCRTAADTLLGYNLYETALRYYQPLLEISDQINASLKLQIGRCLLGLKRDTEAEQSLIEAVQLNDSDTEARTLLTLMYEEKGETLRAFEMINQAQEREEPQDEALPSQQKRKRNYRRQSRKKSYALESENVRKERLQASYQALQATHKGMREGNLDATDIWMRAAQDLTDDFRGVRTFYPWDKYLQFKGYTAGERRAAENSLNSNISEIAARLSRSLGADAPEQPVSPENEIPDDYRGIAFSEWLDIFLEYAICLARGGRKDEWSEVISAAKDAIIYYHSRDCQFLIHLCWAICGLITTDDQAVVNAARFFMKDHQFTTDAYRMFSLLTRINNVPMSWYSSGPTQKFVLRQLKTMDYALVSEDLRQRHYGEKASYSTVNQDGEPVINTDMDISLIMLYGWILFVGTSYQYALNYFLRAHALDPDNAMINLSIGLAYLHHSLKRQVDNRQHNILQGLTFVFRYYDMRSLSEHAEERLEAHYNVARCYHMLGLVHLALPYYWKVLNESVTGLEEDLLLDTAYNMQTIYMMSGNMELAQSITNEFLVI